MQQGECQMRKLLMIATLVLLSLVCLIAQTGAYCQTVSTRPSSSVYAADAVTTTRMMTNQTTTSTTSQAATSTSTVASANSSLAQSPEDFTIKADPTSWSIDLGNGKIPTAAFSVQIEALSGFKGKVELSVKGLPESAKASFNPEEGAPTPIFASILTIFLSQSTPAGAYNVSVIGASNNLSHNATTELVVEGSSSTSTTTVQQQRRLTVSVSTERESYQKGDSVSVSGYVKLESGESVANATVTLHVTDPLGNETHVSLASTDSNGRYWHNFTVPSNALDGTYTVYAVADAVPYRESFGQVTFVVGVSLVPSVRIVNATLTMLNGTISSEFRRGETVAVWVAIDDSGGDLVNGNTWVEVLDPNNSPVSVAVVVVTIHSGEDARIGIQVILKPDAAAGLYTVRIVVSNAPILGGGRFLDSRETAFVVEG
jgi:uncharacterized membrane protein